MNKLHEVSVEVWETRLSPDEWTQSVFIPLPKKGDPLQCCNYRTIALVSHASKILPRVILDACSCSSKEKLLQNKLDLDQREARMIR